MVCLYKNRDWLCGHYVDSQEPMLLVAKKAGCSYKTIWDWLHKFDIPTRGPDRGALYRNRDWLYEHYVEMEESTYAIAQEADCNHMTILNWLRKFDIPTRTLGKAMFLAQRNYLDVSPELLTILSGELLGDGYVQMGDRSHSARYHHTSKYEEYLIWLSGIFADLGLEQVGKINRYDGVKRGKPYTSYNYTSRFYPELVPIRQRFYPKGKKIVPKNLILTPIMARQWYIGDGSLHNQARGRPCIDFSTCDFDKASIDYLLEELRNKGFKVSHWPVSNRIGMSAYSTRDFLDYIGPCPIDCYQYKWNYQDNRKKYGKI